MYMREPTQTVNQISHRLPQPTGLRFDKEIEIILNKEIVLKRFKSKKISNDQELIQSDPTSCRGARWLSGRVSDSGARGPGFETYRRRVVSLSKTLYSPKVLVNYPGSDGSVPI